IAGIASKLSIAFGIAQALHREGAELAFTYPNEKLKKRVDDFAEQFGSKLVFPCDVAVDADIDNAFAELAKHWDGLDGVVHSIGGIASKLSIAFGIAQALHREGAELAFTYPNEKLKKRVDDFAEQFGSKLVFPCDVAVDADIDNAFAELAKHWDGLDGVVHSI